ncbi:hypothetical protein RND81_05G261900 [Saponaria officinalis]|uniref:C2H2-type domain-containing protein n=1 Tax=Saponaria officinalis TaxID=3572 RepID=A0AAW1L2H0_SAPOF
MANLNLTSHLKSLFFSLLLLLLHLGCFICFSSTNNKNNNNINYNDNNYLPPIKKRKLKVISISSSWSFIKKVFTSKNNNNITTQTPTTTSFCSPRSSHYSNIIPVYDSDLHPRKKRSGSRSEYESSLYENPLLPLRNDIYPCPSCGEIFLKPNLLEQHQTTKHAVSELRDGDSGKNIVWIIFKTGWKTENNNNNEKFPKIHRILKIHNGQMILSKFEEYREIVKVKAKVKPARNRNERCIADGNELLRFHCTTFACNLGQNGNSSVCNQNYCSACGIIRVGFSPKLDGISTLSSSYRAHMSIPGDVEDEFAFMNVKRAMLVCRVIAGRVGCDPMMTEVDKEDQGFDSLVGRGGTGQVNSDDDELIVFNPRAVLPCFVIVYSV